MSTFQHPLAHIALQQCRAISMERERRKRILLAIERLLDDAERRLSDVDSVSQGKSFDEAAQR